VAPPGRGPWNGVRWVAVAVEALTDEDPATYARSFLTAGDEAMGERFGGTPAVAFELFSR
jgi:hypothetical protein